MPNGWHLGVLIPLLLLVITTVLSYSGEIERSLFGGDIRLFLADFGIDFDQRNALVIGLAMGFAVIPTIFTIAEDAVFSVPKHLSDGSLALGATQWQTLTRVVLLTASPGIFSAIMIGLGRAVGETMIVLMATGNTPLLDWNMLEGMRTLSATIAVEMPESDVGSSHYRLLFLAALILFIFTFMLNSLAEVVRQRLRDKYSSM
jgi:phosphate transport system permease protein